MKQSQNSRGAGKRNNVITQCANPGKAQLCDRYAFTIRDDFQIVYELEVMADVLWRG
jgi:hypothetical protein